jgi:hypothetical protein
MMKKKRKRMNLHQYFLHPFLLLLPLLVSIGGCLGPRQAHVMLVPDPSAQQ